MAAPHHYHYYEPPDTCATNSTHITHLVSLIRQTSSLVWPPAKPNFFVAKTFGTPKVVRKIKVCVLRRLIELCSVGHHVVPDVTPTN